MTNIARSVVRIAAVALGWLAIGGPARAAVQWKAIGPWSETVEALALDPKNAKTEPLVCRQWGGDCRSSRMSATRSR